MQTTVCSHASPLRLQQGVVTPDTPPLAGASDTPPLALERVHLYMRRTNHLVFKHRTIFTISHSSRRTTKRDFARYLLLQRHFSPEIRFFQIKLPFYTRRMHAVRAHRGHRTACPVLSYPALLYPLSPVLVVAIFICSNTTILQYLPSNWFGRD